MERSCVRLGKTRVWLAQGDFEQDAPPCSYVVIDTSDLINDSRSDDFGPMTALAITKLVTAIDNKLARHREKHVVFVADDGSRGLTNAAFLLGAYMVLKHDTEPDEIWSWFQSCNLREYKDGSRSGSRFRLSVLDCWRALDKAKALRWFCWPDKSGCWGAFDPVEYEHYDNPLNGDIHVVVPDRMVAFCGPRHVSGDREYVDDVGAGLRTFSPRYYIDIFEMMKVSMVVRLNQPHYDKREFEEGGFDHLDLPFPDGSPPSEGVVRRFFEAVDRSHGVIAVHCASGLGRTGTVIALFLMRDYGFSAREAMGWLRMIRPGSVVGEQQDFLCGAKWDASELSDAGRPRFRPTSDVRPRVLAHSASMQDVTRSPDVTRPPAVCTLLRGRDAPHFGATMPFSRTSSSASTASTCPEGSFRRTPSAAGPRARAPDSAPREGGFGGSFLRSRAVEEEPGGCLPTAFHQSFAAPGGRLRRCNSTADYCPPRSRSAEEAEARSARYDTQEQAARTFARKCGEAGAGSQQRRTPEPGDVERAPSACGRKGSEGSAGFPQRRTPEPAVTASFRRRTPEGAALKC